MLIFERKSISVTKALNLIKGIHFHCSKGMGIVAHVLVAVGFFLSLNGL